MTDEARWRRVEEIFVGALERTGDDRTAFVAAACGDDEALRQEVKGLLAHEAAGEGFLTASIGTLAAQVFGGVPATLDEGTRFGSYEIGARIGAGGMGVVYRATDTMLARPVAIKVLSSAFANEPERLARFEREARTLASLNHPHIAQVYGLEQANGIRALIMEWVEGQDLSQLIVGRPKPVNEVLAIARQIAEALEAAHEQRIIHRDLKPANIRVRPDGVVKVLDFGLAKVSTRHAAIQSADNSLARAASATELGLILGTPAYMSPEQAKGHAIDTRTDIWAFGAVLYEMLTGMRAFDGQTVIETLASVIAGAPDYSTLPAGTPLRLQHLLQRCLERDIKMRLRDIGEARIDLSRLEADAIDKKAAEPLRLFQSGRAAWSGRAQFQLALPSGVELDFDAGGSVSVSPDGRYIVFVAMSDGRRALWLRPIDSTESRLLRGTERASLPFWSPDGGFVAFFAESKLKTLEIRTGIVHVICDASPRPGGGAWSRHGVILLAPDVDDPRGASSSHEPMLDQPTRESHRLFRVFRTGEAMLWPAFLPGGNHCVFQAVGRTNSGIYLAEFDNWLSEATLLIKQDSFDMTAVRYGTGHLLFVRDHTLVAQPFDTPSLKLSGDAFPLAKGFGIGGPGTPAFAVSDNGVLVFREEGAQPTFQLTWFGADGARQGTLGEPGPYRSFDLSPDGKTLAVDRFTEKETSVWLMDIRRGVPQRFTTDGMSFAPRWSPQGDRLVFESVRDTAPNPFVRTLGGSEQRLARLRANVRVTSWAPDGGLLVGHFRDDRGKGFDDLWLFSASGEEPPRLFLLTPFHKRDASVSPDGRWVAFASDESGTPEIYVTTFPTTGRRALRVSSGGGQGPRWRHDGKELFFQANNSIVGASVARTSGDRERGVGLEIGTPRKLFKLPSGAGFWVPARRGRFLVSVPVTKAVPAPIQVVINWNSRTNPGPPV